MARRVSEVLNLGLYDDSKLRAEAIRMGLEVGKLEGFKEKASAWFGLMRDKPAQALD